MWIKSSFVQSLNVKSPKEKRNNNNNRSKQIKHKKCEEKSVIYCVAVFISSLLFLFEWKIYFHSHCDNGYCGHEESKINWQSAAPLTTTTTITIKFIENL